MTYEAWRISYPDGELAAKVAYRCAQDISVQLGEETKKRVAAEEESRNARKKLREALVEVERLRQTLNDVAYSARTKTGIKEAARKALFSENKQVKESEDFFNTEQAKIGGMPYGTYGGID